MQVTMQQHTGFQTKLAGGKNNTSKKLSNFISSRNRSDIWENLFRKIAITESVSK